MSRRAAFFATVSALVFAAGSGAFAQITLQPTPLPTVTAETRDWYTSGAPISLNRGVYYPSGPIRHFLRNEMVESGVFDGVAVYTLPTQEPGSIIYVPVSGGLVRPYERRRSGDLAGTVGSTTSSFPIILPAEEARRPAVPAPGVVQVPSQAALPEPVGTAGFMYGTPGARPFASEPPAERVAASVALPGPDTRVLTALSSAPARTLPRRVETLQRPTGINNVYLEFRDVRWFAAGPAIEFSAERFVQIGERRGFPVYEEPGRPNTIYVSLVAGPPGLVAPYTSR